MEDAVVETWQSYNRLHLPEDSPAAQMGGKGCHVGALFTHCYNVRRMRLQSAAPELLTGLTKFAPEADGGRDALTVVLQVLGQ